MKEKKIRFLNDRNTETETAEKTGTVIQGEPITIEKGTSSVDWLDYVTASDAVDGDITAQVKVNDSFVHLNESGQYLLVYEVTNSRKQTTYKSILVTVQDKTEETPEISKPPILEDLPDEPEKELGELVEEIYQHEEQKANTLVKEQEADYADDPIEAFRQDARETSSSEHKELRIPSISEPAFLEKLLTEGIQLSSGELIWLDKAYLQKHHFQLGEPGRYWVPYRTHPNELGNSHYESQPEHWLLIIVGRERPLLYANDMEIKAGTPRAQIDWLKGVIAFDPFDQNITAKIKCEPQMVSLSKEGLYPVTYLVTNSAGVTTTLYRLVAVKAERPTLKVASLQIEAGSEPRDIDWYKSITAYDVVDGNIVQNCQVDYSKVNFEQDGTYPIVYTVRNSNGKEQKAWTEVEVNAVEPIISGEPFEVTAGSSVHEIDWKANIHVYDPVDQDLLEEVEVDLGNVDISKEGQYEVHYKVANSNHKIGELRIQVFVKAEVPHLHSDPITITANRIIDSRMDWKQNLIAEDKVDGNIAEKVRVDFSQIDPQVEGTYQIYFEVSNSNNKTAKIEVPVFVKAEAPTIVASPIHMSLGTEVDQFDWLNGVLATDKVDGDITTNLTVFYQQVDSNTAGEYTVTYLVRNSNHKQGSRTMAVKVQ